MWSVMGWRRYTILAGILAAVVIAGRSTADESVVRVSVADGEVTYLRGDDDARDNWTGLGVNTPLTTGDAVYVGKGGRVELAVGRGQLIHFDGGTEVELTNVTSSLVQISVNMGRTHVTFRRMADGSAIEIDTWAGAATGHIAGEYQAMVDERKTSFQVVSGALTVTLNGKDVQIEQGRRVEIRQEDPAKYSEGRVEEPGKFDQWAKARDDRSLLSEGRQTVNAAVVGIEDLDEGGWKVSEKYGKYWTPTGVREGWAPCRDGRWIWKDPDGWTWISDEPWGWASCHYGRWIHEERVWGWVPPPAPGEEVPEVVASISSDYSPAVVGFIGGPGWNGGPGGSAVLVGWVPLAPEDRVTSNPQGPQIGGTARFALLGVDDAATMVRMDTFGNGRTEYVRVSRKALQVAPMLGLRPRGVLPTRDSLIAFPERRVTANGRPFLERTKTRPVLWRQEPPKRIQPFSAKLPEIRRTGEPVRRPVVRIPTTGSNAGDTGLHGGASRASTSSLGRPRDRGEMQTAPSGQGTSRGPRKWGPDQKPRDNERGTVQPRASGPQNQQRGQSTATSGTNGTPTGRRPAQNAQAPPAPKPARNAQAAPPPKPARNAQAAPPPKPAQKTQAAPQKN